MTVVNVEPKASPAADTKQETRPRLKRVPLEVLVQDRWTGTWVHAEYRGEVNRKGPEPRYKVYSPFFVALDQFSQTTPDAASKAHRWVGKIKIRGPASPQSEVDKFLLTTTTRI